MVRWSKTSKHTHATQDLATPKASHSNARAIRSGHVNVTAGVYGRTPSAKPYFFTTPLINKSQLRWNRVSCNLQTSARPVRDSQVDLSSEDEDSLLLDSLMSTSWKIYHVSPLFNLQINRARLKQYGKYVRERLSCLNIHNKQNVQFTANFTWFGEVRVNFQGLQVEVKTILENKPAKTSYLGFFVSSDHAANSSRHRLHLPILLCYGGNKVIIQEVHNILFNLFDCIIVQLPIPETELMWLSAMLISDPDSRPKENDITKFKFQIALNNASNTFSVQLFSKDITKLWHIVHDSQSTLVTHEEVKSFHDSLYRHLSHTYSIDLTKCILVMFSLPTLRVDSCGSIKMLSRYSAAQALTFFNNLIVEYHDS